MNPQPLFQSRGPEAPQPVPCGRGWEEPRLVSVVRTRTASPVCRAGNAWAGALRRYATFDSIPSVITQRTPAP